MVVYTCLDTIRECSKAGFEVINFTPNQVRGLSKADRKKYAKSQIVNKGFFIHKSLKCFSFFERNYLFRVIRYWLFGRKAVRYLKKEKDLKGLFVWSYPPIGFVKAIAKFAKKSNVPLILDVHDIQPEIMKTNPIFDCLIRKNTNYVLANSSYVFTLSKDMCNTLVSKGVNKNKITVIPPWKYEISHEAKIPEDILEKTKNKYVVGYIGNIGLFQNIDLLLNAAILMKEYEDIVFLFVGNGALKEKVEEIQSKFTNILYFNKVDPDVAALLYEHVDLNIISLNDGLIKYACPSKTPMVLRANRDILLVLNDSEYSRELVNDGAYLNKEFTADGLKETILMIKSSKNKPSFTVKSYDSNLCLSKWYDFFNELNKDYCK